MPATRLCIRLFVTLAILAFTLTTSTPAPAQAVNVLYSSTGPNPQAAVTFNAAGDLFWTANTLVNELTPQTGGGFSYSIPFASDNNSDPEGTVVFDSAGNLYGVAGPFKGNDGYVFELSPVAGGGWTEQTIYTFSATGKRGSSPYVGLTIDSSGNLYGTTAYGGAYGGPQSGGTVFELSTPQAGGPWVQKVLHNFGNGLDGQLPWSSLILDSAGNLYGTTQIGGEYTYGTVYELTHQPGGTWKETILHTFSLDADGQAPYNNLALDAAGNLYGATIRGGYEGLGTVFELSPQANGTWSEKILHGFSGRDGSSPYSGVTLDSAGNIYGTTFSGGAVHDAGIIFELVPKGNGNYSEKVLHGFTGTDGDGANPLAGVVFGPDGNLYGTTEAGGTNGEGTVYEMAP